MRWLSYIILAYLALALQIGLGPYIRYHGAAPDFVIIALLFIGANASKEPALLGSFLMGLVHDLISGHPLGLYALAYGLAGLLVVRTHQVVYRDHPLTHFSLALGASLIVAVVVLIHGYFRPPGVAVKEQDAILSPVRMSIGVEFTRAVYTALLAPIVLGLLQRSRRLFAFGSSRRKISRSADLRR